MFLLKSFLAAIGSIITIFAMTKLMGQKQISQLNMFDYINGITIGSIAAEMSISTDMREISIAFLSILVYGFVGFALSMASIKSIKARRFITGCPVVLIGNGNIYRENLKKSKLDINDLLMQARTKGYFNISDVSYAILEGNGQISFLPSAEARPANPSDLGITPSPENLLANVIMDGKVMKQNLRHTGNDEQWLSNQLKLQGFGSASEVFLATVDKDNNLSCFKMIDSDNSRNIFC